MRLRNRGKFDPYTSYLPGDCFEKQGKWFIVDRGGSARLSAATPDPVLDRIPLDGKPGERGVNGRDGRDGVDGSPGPPGLVYAGEWRKKSYLAGQVVEHEGSSYVCRVDGTKRKPTEDSPHWGLLSKAGADGRDGYHTSSHRVTRTEMATNLVPVKAIFDSDTLKGQVVYISGDGHVDLARADNSGATFTAVGIATGNFAAGQPGEYVIGGPVECDTWSLEPGKMYYLSPYVAGGMTTEYPDGSGQFVVLLGVAGTATLINLNVHYYAEQS